MTPGRTHQNSESGQDEATPQECNSDEFSEKPGVLRSLTVTDFGGLLFSRVCPR